MKYFAFVFIIAAFFTSCAANQKPVASENSAQSTPEQKTTVASSSNSSPEDFDKSLPLKVREALENAEEIEIWTLVNYDYPTVHREFIIGSFQISADKLTKVAKGETRTELLEAFYEDVRTGGARAACFTPHHTLTIDYKGEKIAIAICFHCGHFIGVISNERFGNKPVGKKENGKGKLKEEKFSGVIPNIETSKSLPIFNKITETN